MSDIASLLGELTPEQRTVSVCVRGDLAARIDELTRKLADAALVDTGSLAGPEGLADLAEQIAEAEAEAEEFMRDFVVQAVPHLAWRRLMAAHPPTVEQAERGFDHNPDTFQHAAVALCCVSPRMTEDEALTLAGGKWDPTDPQSPRGLTEGQWSRIWQAVLELNRGGGEAPKSALATAVRRLTAPKSTTAPSEASPTASS